MSTSGKKKLHCRRKLLRENFILVFFFCSSVPLRNAKGFDERKSLQDYTFLITSSRVEENRTIAISPVKTKRKNTGQIYRVSRCVKAKKIYRLLLHRGSRMDMKTFCIQFHVCYMCSAVLRSPLKRSQGKLNLFFSFSFLRFLCVDDILQFCRM